MVLRQGKGLANLFDGFLCNYGSSFGGETYRDLQKTTLVEQSFAELCRKLPGTPFTHCFVTPHMQSLLKVFLLWHELYTLRFMSLMLDILCLYCNMRLRAARFRV